MAKLSFIEKRQLESALEMGSGYVLNFSNSTLGEFVQECTGTDIYDSKYEANGTSKANRLRTFFALELDDVVGKLISELLDYRSAICGRLDDDACRRIAERLTRGRRLEEPGTVPTISSVSYSVKQEPALPTQGSLSVAVPRLPQDGIHQLHEVAIRLGLGREALMAGVNTNFVSGLAIATKLNEQILLDLSALNTAGCLTDQTDPLQLWLKNAERLSASRHDGLIFSLYLRLLATSRTSATIPLPVDEASDIVAHTAAARGVRIAEVHLAPTSPYGTLSFRSYAADGLGVVYCHATGSRRGSAFYVRKGIGWFYEQVLGGSSSRLGLPTSNEELVDRTRGAASFFEGGRIDWSLRTSVARATLVDPDGKETLLLERSQ